MGKREKNNEAVKDQARKMGQYFDNEVFEGTSTMELVDAFKLTDKVKTDFIDISNISREEMKMLVDLYYQLQVKY